MKEGGTKGEKKDRKEKRDNLFKSTMQPGSLLKSIQDANSKVFEVTQ